MFGINYNELQALDKVKIKTRKNYKGVPYKNGYIRGAPKLP